MNIQCPILHKERELEDIEKCEHRIICVYKKFHIFPSEMST